MIIVTIIEVAMLSLCKKEHCVKKGKKVKANIALHGNPI